MPISEVDLGLGGSAYRFDPAREALPGYIFECDDDLIVQVRGDLNGFRAVITSLREAEPGEFDVLEPQP